VDLVGVQHYGDQMRRGVHAGPTMTPEPETSPDREPSRALTLRPSPARQRLLATAPRDVTEDDAAKILSGSLELW